MNIDLLSMNPKLLFGAAGMIGAGIRGLIAYFRIKKKSKKFDISQYSDTLIEGIASGIAFSIGLPICYASLGITLLAGAGIDTYTNKLGIKILPLLRDFVKGLKKKKK